MDQSKLKDIKKTLMSGVGYIRIGTHTKKRMGERGYTKGDMVSGLMTGKITEVQYGFNDQIGSYTFKFVIEGKDTSDNPIVIILSEEDRYKFKVVTVMPPIDRKRFKNCI